MATDQNGVVRVRTNPKFFRPAEVDLLIGDPAYAKEKLGWETKTTFEQLIQMMVESDLAMYRKLLMEAMLHQRRRNDWQIFASAG